MNTEQHPKGSRAKVLLTSVFGPYAQDDSYGSRSINPMELYHNQVTRVQGPFSLRMFHRSWGIMMIQANIDAPSTVLDFPTLDRFIDEIRNNDYDIIGISSIIPNVGKVNKMCTLIRKYRPGCKIVIGGHVANLPGVENRIDADHIVSGEGISWFRRYLGQDENQPIAHPEILSGFGGRALGVSLSGKPADTAAVLIPSVGCPMGCNFCSTSAMFGGKGKAVNFYNSGEELFKVMCRLEARMKTRSFFVMDENFLLYRKRALELLNLMRRHNKSWSLYVFSSAQAIKSYSEEELVGLGISWVWMGLEGEDSTYSKLKNIDTLRMVRMLQSHGIKVLGSSIIGLESHSPAIIDNVIDYSVQHDTDFHQFMLYTPVPGTPLYEYHKSQGTLLPGIEEADTHGQYRFNFRHPQISREQSEEFLLRAFRQDYESNGPSIMRIARTVFQGWKKHKNHPEKRVRERFRREAGSLLFNYAAALWAMERYFHGRNQPLVGKIRHLRAGIIREFGPRAALLGNIGGRLVGKMIQREEKKLREGWTYEPPTFVERKNWNAAKQRSGEGAGSRGSWLRLPELEWLGGKSMLTILKLS
jgi:radical SAM superfamily enzyme YgiQ (UPF0313 family)